MREYKWNGRTYQIADEDLKFYPGAEPVTKEPQLKADQQPKDKARKTVKNKAKE